MIKRQKLIETIQTLPEEFTLDEVLDHLLLMEKLDDGIKQSGSRDVVSDNDVEKYLPN